MLNKKNNQKGFATFYITILILAVIFGIAVSISILTLGQQKISQNIVKSSQAYYAAEAGIEDALLRLEKGWSTDIPLLKVGDATASTTISDIVEGARTITSEGNSSNRIRRAQVVYVISSEKISFYYGVQVGEGGIEMQDSSKIEGNVFSNGSVLNLGGNPEITGTAKIAKTGNYLERMIIGGDALVDECRDSEITGKLTVRVNQNCTASTTKELSEEIATSSLPISDEQINSWKEDAASGGVISGNFTIQGKQEVFLGPKKIEGSLTMQDNAKLFVTGTIWVVGEIVVQDQGQVILDKETFGSDSGVIVADGRITVQDSSIISGTGQSGSYLMLLSTFGARVKGDTAIVVQNSPQLDIIYAHNGQIILQDSIRLKQASGWGLKLQNKATVIYESGLEDASFTSGPGGDWEVTSWKEIK